VNTHNSTGAPRLTVVIPTHRRPRILTETLTRLGHFGAQNPIEVIVVHDGEDERTATVANEVAQVAPWPLSVLVQSGFGPAPKRNRAIAEARAACCLFIGDDALPSAELLATHIRFHDANPDRSAALLGLTVPAPPLDASPYIEWLHREGVQFDYARLAAGDDAGPGRFWTINVSAKTELMRDVGGFNEDYPVVAGEDIEFGYLLARAGMRLTYEPRALNFHFHPTSLSNTLIRMKDVGVGFRMLCERVPEVEPPSRPGARHRLKAAALSLALACGAPGGTRERTWRFLCDEMMREAFWDQDPGALPRIGHALSRRATREEIANPPFPLDPDPGQTRG